MGFFTDILASPVAGGIISGGLGFAGGKSANKSSAASIKEQMDFQERMSNTEYQRTMKDMRSAGLNPMLAAKLGGASSPSGASMTFQNVGAAAAEGISKGTSSAIGAKLAQAQLDQIKAATMLSEQQNTSEIYKQVNTEADTNVKGATARILDEDLTTAKKAAKQSEIDTKLIQDNPLLRKIGAILRELGITGNSAISSMRK